MLKEGRVVWLPTEAEWWDNATDEDLEKLVELIKQSGPRKEMMGRRERTVKRSFNVLVMKIALF